MRKEAKVFVVSGPSGCGKTTLCKELLKNMPGLIKSVSVTTRAPRKGETRNRDYVYVSGKKFKSMLAEGRFIEHAKVFGEFYGTPKKPFLAALKKGKDILLSIDVKGAAQVKRAFKKAVLIFILPPSFNALQKRLLKRSSDTKDQIEKRLRIAHNEMSAVRLYDYAVINDSLKKAVEELSSIVRAERCMIEA